MDPTAGKLANAVEAFAGQMLTELAKPTDRGDVNEHIDMLTSHPGAAAVSAVKSLNLLQRIGDYSHPDEQINEFIKKNWAQMDGSLEIAYSEMSTASSIGWAALEFAVRPPTAKEWLIESLMLIPPKYHTFEGSMGRIEGVRYYPTQGTDFQIPYSSTDEYKGGIVHIINRREVAALTDHAPYGIADCRLANAAWKAWKIIVAEALVAGQRQATPLLWGKDDENASMALIKADGTPLLDSNGEQIYSSGPNRLLTQMQKLDANGGILTTGLRGEVRAINQQTDGKFFMEMLKYLDKLISKAFLIPNTVLEEGVGGLGNAGLASAQLENMRLMLDQLATQIQEELLEKVIRPLITWQFGEQEDYGTWAQPEDSESVEMMEAKTAQVAALTQAAVAGIYSITDVDFQNRHRELTGVPLIEETATRAARSLNGGSLPPVNAYTQAWHLIKKAQKQTQSVSV